MTLKKDFVHQGEVLHAKLEARGDARYLLTLGARTIEVAAERLANGSVRFALAGKTFVADAAPCGKQLQVRVAGHTYLLEPSQGRGKAGGDAAAGKVIEAPMTGTVTKVLVAQGQQVEKGQTLVVLTAMKMEHKLNAGIAGKVAELAAKEGAIVDSGAVLVRLE